MQLDFSDGDEAAYFSTRDQLLDEIRSTFAADGRRDGDAGEAVASIESLLDWRWNYSNGRLDDWRIADLDEFLLGWVPAKLSAPAEEGAAICSAVADFFVHMGGRERLTGGTERAAALVAHAYELSDRVVEAMGDPANFGMAKSMFMGPRPDGSNAPIVDLSALLESGVEPGSDEFQALLDQKMEEFNALPFEERKALTDPGMSGAVPPAQRIRIPVVDWPPTDDELADSIAESRLLTMVDGLVDHIGTGGIAVTQAGNLRLADARTLVELLDTGDEVEHHYPWADENDEPEPIRSSTELPVLTLAFDTAEAAGAFDRLKTKVKVLPGWLALPNDDRAQAVVDGLLAIGPISSSARHQYFWEVAAIVEDAIPHWLSLGLPADAEISVDGLVDTAVDVVGEELPARGPLLSDPTSFRSFVDRNVCELFGVLDLAGIVRWEGHRTLTSEFGSCRQTGGYFSLTPLGRFTMVGHIRHAGYDFPTLTDLAEADAVDAVNTMLTTELDPADALARWRPTASVTDRAAALADVVMTADALLQRIAAMDLIRLLEPVAEVEPAVRQMLDSDAAGYAAAYLVEHGLASPEEMAPFHDVGLLIDLLSTLLDDPAAMSSLFLDGIGDGAADLIDDIWREERGETLDVLEALGKHLPDKKLAKAARKAAMQHRSFMANRGH